MIKTKYETMKKYFAIVGAVVMALTCSCVGGKGSGGDDPAEAGTKTYCFKDSCQHLVVSMSLELPMGTDSVSMRIRDAVIADFMLNARMPGLDQENEFSIPEYTGDKSDAQAIVDYFGKADYDYLLEIAMTDYNDRIQGIEESTTMSAEEKEEAKQYIPQFAFNLSLQQTADTLGFVVYQSQAYVYYGGAHGGVTGTGAITFDKTTGKKIDRFVKEDATADLQPLFIRGFRQYYSSYGETLTDKDVLGRLFLQGDTIPQPANIPCPNATGDSLVFVYRQYEIACYADGMPSFALAVKDLEPYLTDEGKAIFKK